MVSKRAHSPNGRLRADLEALCSDACAGRAPGTHGGLLARELVMDALLEAGLDAQQQAVPACNGANVLAHLPGASGRWVLVGAHYDHLGARAGHVYRGADDNAAAVALVLALARALATRPPAGHGVVLAVFDCEEPPHFLLGSQHYTEHPSVPLVDIDLAVCMDLVGHKLGPADAPAAIRESVFVLGAEHSVGTSALIDSVERTTSGVIARRANADIVPPLSDYWPFWESQVPFLFLTCGRSRHYHTPEDTPDKLEDATLFARARWLEQLTRAACARVDSPVRFSAHGRDDAATLCSLRELACAIEPASTPVARARAAAEALLAQCDSRGHLPAREQRAVQALVSMLERELA